MKKSVSRFLILTTAVLFLWFSGCTKEKEADLKDWSTPRLDKEAAETEKGAASSKEAEQAIKGPQPLTYRVKKDDSIIAIAKQHGISPQRLAEANNLKLKGSKSIIHPGQILIIPVVNKNSYSYEE
jgi:LysM repeat protein